MGKKEGFTNYILRDIPTELWKKVKAKAILEDRELKEVIMEGLKAFLADRKKNRTPDNPPDDSQSS